MTRFIHPLRQTLLLFLLALAAGPTFAAGKPYTLDPGHTQVQFNWSHMGFSHPGAGFDDVSGTVVWDPRRIDR